jgi:hypothetical protein
MTQRRKLELELNQPKEITLLYDEPVSGRSTYGTYNLYAVESEGEEYSFFAPDEVHNKIKNLSKGDRVVITKVPKKDDKGRISTHYDLLLPRKAYNEPVHIKEAVKQIIPEQNKDRLYDIMLKSLQDAVDIANTLGGMVDANRIGITLFIARSKTNAYGG